MEWNNSLLIKGDLISEVKALKSGSVGEIQTIGSGKLAEFLMQNYPVD